MCSGTRAIVGITLAFGRVGTCSSVEQAWRRSLAMLKDDRDLETFQLNSLIESGAPSLSPRRARRWSLPVGVMMPARRSLMRSFGSEAEFINANVRKEVASAFWPTRPSHGSAVSMLCYRAWPVHTVRRSCAVPLK